MVKTPSPPALTTLYLLAAISPLTLNMIVPSLANISHDLNADYAVISLALGGFLAATAVVELIVGPLSDRVGRRPVLLAALGVFSVASLGCALARSAEVFLAFRMLQAGAVSGYVLSLAIVRDTRDGPQVAALLGRIGMAMALAPMLGPVLGSLLDAALGWRAVFMFYGAAGLGLVLLTWVDLGETAKPLSDADDPEASRLGSLFGSAVFWSYAFCTALSIGAFYVFLAGAPLIASGIFGITTVHLGFFVGSITAGFMFGSFLVSRFGPRYGQGVMMLVGRVVACAGLFVGLAALAVGSLTPLLYFGCTIFVGLGNGLTIPNSNAGAMSVRPRLAGSAAGITGALTLAIGAVLATSTSLILQEHPSPEGLLILMLTASFAALLSAAAAIRLERRAAQVPVG
ncbi:MAG: multidrug effflux MFS transporter [Pseudomonadota bacterium]